ncbi:hypothetical protein M406DRAFT_101632 [Cryphonectria parasitica EP155]|uniref:Uncharacterized protein n=1 Tax=Cryphonectria parasitica (strain ATCC 38755 / EP155) TaxID=660469 RepID=A0A9P5CPA1_CRYP1|nr:uncharacterized protein M406DRAFT_101632 [Cryphonectria parasitica EP155]KAF3766264.1 hypothetical protein M406DRAFT_101632 [Cryphonectria parasitica EP155]
MRKGSRDLRGQRGRHDDSSPMGALPFQKGQYPRPRRGKVPVLSPSISPIPVPTRPDHTSTPSSALAPCRSVALGSGLGRGCGRGCGRKGGCSLRARTMICRSRST